MRRPTSGQAASSRSTPLETISLPTKTTREPERVGSARSVAAPPARGGTPRCRRPGGPAASSLAGRDVRERRPERLGRVAGADQHPVGRLHPLSGVGQEARMGFDRVLERRAVDLGGEGADAGAGEDRRAHHQVVGEGGVDPAGGVGDLADGGDVGLDVAVELGLAQLGEGLDLEALVGVLARRRAAGRRCRGCGSATPSSSDLAVLAEQMDLVAEPASARARLAL